MRRRRQPDLACENAKPGTPPSVWDVDGPGDASIQGFATDIGVDAGQRIDFEVDTSAAAYTITIYRTGYYGGDGAREVATVTPSASLPQVQPPCVTDAVTELYDCGTWGVSASWDVPGTAVAGVYLARLERTDNHDASHVTFVARNDTSTSDVVFQTADPTWQAYNTYVGSNLHHCSAKATSGPIIAPVVSSARWAPKARPTSPWRAGRRGHPRTIGIEAPRLVRTCGTRTRRGSDDLAEPRRRRADAGGARGPIPNSGHAGRRRTPPRSSVVASGRRVGWVSACGGP